MQADLVKSHHLPDTTHVHAFAFSAMTANTIFEFLFLSKSPADSDPLWLIVAALVCGVILLILGILGKKLVKGSANKALQKTVKRSTGWLKGFGILYFVLLWFRLEALRILSMKFWFILADLAFLFFIVVKVRYYHKLKRRIERGMRERGES